MDKSSAFNHHSEFAMGPGAAAEGHAGHDSHAGHEGHQSHGAGHERCGAGAALEGWPDRAGSAGCARAVRGAAGGGRGRGGLCEGVMGRAMALLRTPLARALGTVVAAGMGTMVMGQAHAANVNLPDLNKAWNATIQRNDTSVSAMTVVSDKSNALLIWDDFNVAAGSHVYFKAARDQPVSFLNVVKGPGRTSIDGHVVGQNDNINFYLVNPNGVRVGTTGSIEGMKSTYLGTSRLSQQTLDRFKDGNAAPVGMNALPETLAMGDVKLYGSVHSAAIKVNGDQIVIGEIEKVLPSTTAGDVLELHSGKGRIDIGGDIDSVRLDSRPQQNGAADNKDSLAGSTAPGRNAVTYRELLRVNGLKAAARGDIKFNGTHDNGKFVDHSAQQAVYNADGFYNAFSKNSSGDYWLTDDITLDYERDSMGALNKSFSGTLDGAFYTVTLTGKVRDSSGSTVTGNRNHGLFASLDGAEISNMKIMTDGLALDSSLRGQDFNFGLLAGTIKDSTLANVEIDRADVRISAASAGSGDYMGALAGRIEGNNGFTAVMSSWSDNTANQLGSRNGLKAGHVTGSNSGKVLGLMVAGTGNMALAAVGEGNDDGMASSFSEAWNKSLEQMTASGLSHDEALGRLHSVWATSGSAQDGTLAGRDKGFMNAFYIEDFNFMYDGKNHNYADLVNNEGFDINNVLTLVNGTSWDQKNAGQWGFEFTTHKDNQAGGHDYFFTYAHAGDTWDRGAGGSADLQIRNDRVDSIGGVGTLNINKKPLTIALKDQVITEGQLPDLTVGGNTLVNPGDISASLADGDSLADLNLTLKADPVTGKITASYNNGNYDITIVDARLSVIAKPVQPEPQPQPQPQPLPQPAPQPQPDHGNVPSLPAVPSLPVQPDNNDSSSMAAIDHAAGVETRCQNCHTLSSADLGSALWLTDNTVLDLSGIDYTLSIFAALNSGAAPENAGKWLLTSGHDQLAATDSTAPSDRQGMGSNTASASGTTTASTGSGTLSGTAAMAEPATAASATAAAATAGAATDPVTAAAANAASVSEPVTAAAATGTERPGGFRASALAAAQKLPGGATVLKGLRSAFEYLGLNSSKAEPVRNS